MTLPGLYFTCFRSAFNMDNQRLKTIPKWIIYLCILVVLYVKPHHCGSIISVPNKQGFINSSLEITCSYSLDGSEGFDEMTWSRQRADSSYVDIAKIRSNTDKAFYAGAGDLADRSSLSIGNNVGKIEIRELVCADEALYKCRVGFKDGVVTNVEKAMDSKLLVKGKPEKPSELNQVQTEVGDGDDVTFICVSVVGKSPEGSITWQKVDGTTITDLPAGSDSTSDTPGTCTKTVRSNLTIVLTKEDNGKRIRCRTSHSDAAEDSHYLDSNPLVVNYPVSDEAISVYQAPNKQDQTEGTQVILNCNVNSVPKPTYKWYHVDSQKYVHEGQNGRWTITSIAMTDKGEYQCEAENNYFNTTHKATKMLMVYVNATTTTDTSSTMTEKPATPGPTDPTATSSAFTPNGGVTDGSTQPSDDKNTTIIIVVCVIVGVALIAGIVIFILFRKRKNAHKAEKIEAPSEKPYNNNPAINTFSTQPDLVNDEKKKYANQYPYNSSPNPYSMTNSYNHNNSFDKRSDDISYGELNFDHNPRSRKPVALSDADYADISMPRV